MMTIRPSYRLLQRCAVMLLVCILAPVTIHSSAEASGSAEYDSGSGATSSGQETLVFTDVYGNSHLLTVDSAARLHDYNVTDFVLSGQNMTYEDESSYIFRLGIDVSYYQGEVDWTRVKEAGYDFVFLRAGYRGYGRSGSLVEDRTFRTNLAAAKAAGLDVGVYFFSQAVSGTETAEEAAFVLALLDGEPLELPIVYDPEFILDSDGNKISSARMNTVSGEQITANTLAFCAAVEEAGYETAFYTNLLSESEVFDMAVLSDITVWYADYCETPQTPYAFTFWQYSESGFVDGIDGAVDLNIQLIPVQDEPETGLPDGG